MTSQEYIFQLNKQASQLTKELFQTITAKGKEAEVLTLDILERVRDTGKNAKGSNFKPYSSKPMLTGSKNFLNQSNAKAFFSKKNKSSGTDISTLDSGWRTVNGKHLKIVRGGYKEFRALNKRDNTKTKQVFEFSGMMWKDFKIKSKTIDTSGITIVQGMEKENPKLEGNTEREKISIIMPSDKELEKFRTNVNQELIKLISLK